MTKRQADKLRRLGQAVESARAARDQAIADAYAAGLSQVTLAELTGMSRGGVQRVLERTAA